jgi:hypothetical protein
MAIALGSAFIKPVWLQKKENGGMTTPPSAAYD